MSNRKNELKVLLSRLENLTTGMNVPSYRCRNVAWLNKNLAAKNKDHPQFSAAMEIIEVLLANGVSHG